MVIIISVIFSFVASLLSSMLGGGFGLLSVPTIYWIITHFYPMLDHKMQMTIATGSCASITLGLISSIKHIRYKNADFNLYKDCIVFMIIGVLIGAILMMITNSDSLKKIFAVAVFIIAIWMMRFNIQNSKKINFKKYQFNSVSTFLGGISAFLGLSIFNVPFFVCAGINLRKAIGTSVVLVFTYSAIVGLFLTIMGIPISGISSNHIGYLITPIFLSTIIPCVLGSLIGAKLVNVLEQNILKAIYVSLMFIVSLIMLF